MSKENKFFPLLLLSLLLILGAAHNFYPKWQQSGSEATISWDVYGYYLYLPAFFIYDDIEKLEFVEEINQKYEPAGPIYNTTKLENGNATGQYSLGWSFYHLPAFAIGHGLAKINNYPADGFSKPYQIAISFYGMFLVFFGLVLTFLNLRAYFSFQISAATVLLLLIGSNALNYFAIDIGHTHGPLFFLYSFLIFLSRSWHKKPKYITSIAIGFIYGLMCTIRPTEIIALLIPLFWGIGRWGSFKARLQLFEDHKSFIGLSILAFLFFPVLQMSYWKIVTDHFIFYSYVGQTFSWLHPHVIDVLISHRKGWLMYTPLALLFFLGLPFLYRYSKEIFFTVLVFFAFNFYIISAWDIWWYGGSLGQRALVQSYALLVFPLAAVLHYSCKKTWSKIMLSFFLLLSIAHNLAFHYKAHSPAPFEAEAMTKAFFSRTYFEFSPNEEWLKLLDTQFIFEGEGLREDGYKSSLKNKIFLRSGDPVSEKFYLANSKTKPYFRLVFFVKSPEIASYFWNMPQMNIVQLDGNKEPIQSDFIRIHRFMDPNEEKELYFDVKVNSNTELFEFFLSNPHGDKEVTFTYKEAYLFEAK